MMAGPPPIEVKAIWDDTAWKTGTQDSERYLEELERAVNSSADEINRALKTADDGVTSTFGSGGAFDRSVTDVEASGDRLKDTGSEIGAEFAENMGEGFRSGDWGGVVLETFTSLGPALGVAGIGLGLGAALVNGAIQGAKQARQEFYDAVNQIFTTIETRAGKSSDKIQREILKGFTFESVLTEFGGEGGLQAGLEKVNDLVLETGANFNDIVDILRGDINPQNRDTLQLLKDQAEELAVGNDYEGRRVKVISETAQQARDILDASEKTRDAQKGALDAAEKARDYAWSTQNAQTRIANDAERYAAALQRAADNFSRMYGRELPYGVYDG